MDNSLESIQLQLYIGGGIGLLLIIILFILIIILFVKINHLKNDRSNQLVSQRNMMADFCYTNPTIVPGEELSRRGFSMYDGRIDITSETSPSIIQKNNHAYGVYHHDESRSQF